MIPLLFLVPLWTVDGEQEVCKFHCNLANCLNNEVWHEVEMDGPNGDKIVLQQTLRQRPREGIFPAMGKSNIFRRFMDYWTAVGERRRTELQQRSDYARQRIDQFQQYRQRLGRVATPDAPLQQVARERSAKSSRSQKRPQRNGNRRGDKRRVAAQQQPEIIFT